MVTKDFFSGGRLKSVRIIIVPYSMRSLILQMNLIHLCITMYVRQQRKEMVKNTLASEHFPPPPQKKKRKWNIVVMSCYLRESKWLLAEVNFHLYMLV